MIFGGWGYRAYADTAAELCEALIPGYGELGDDTARLKARIVHAVTEQVQLQASINVESDPQASTEAHREVLVGPRHIQPAIARWDCDVPLVLVDIYYEPQGDLPRPVGKAGKAGEADANLIWLSPATEEGYLRSLARAGVIALGDLGAARPQ
jgi:hypothetical protein